MKRFTYFLMAALLVSLLLSVACYSAEVTFVWDYDALQQATLGPTGQFRLYQSTTSMTYTATPVATVSSENRTVTINVPPGTYFWVLTASDGNGNESDYSNEVTAKVKPGKPTNLKISNVK